MVKAIEAEITAMQADFARTKVWLRSHYLPDPLPKVVNDRLEEFEARFDALRDMVEDQEAGAAYMRTRNQETVPDHVVARLVVGENPVRVWREYRGMSLRALAEQTSMSASVLSDMATGKSEGRPGSLRRIARALLVVLDDLVPAAERS